MVDLINVDGSINFSKADMNGNNSLTADELVTALKGVGKTDAQIKSMMEDLVINVDSAATTVAFDFDDGVAGLGVLDFDRLTINDGNETATDFQIFVADTDGLIVDTNTVGFASTRKDEHGNNLTDMGSVLIEDSDAAGKTYANNALSVNLDNTVNWDDSGIHQEDGQYHLTYNINNVVNLYQSAANFNNVVAGFGNEINIAGDFSLHQSYGATGTRNDNAGDDVSANEIGRAHV